MDIEKRVAQYIALRNKIKAEDDAHAEVMKPKKDLLLALNALLLKHLSDIKSESVKTAAGTVYRSERKSASLADPDAFMNYVVEHGLWDLLDRKANATAVADFINENKFSPPGVNFSTIYTAGVRVPHK